MPRSWRESLWISHILTQCSCLLVGLRMCKRLNLAQKQQRLHRAWAAAERLSRVVLSGLQNSGAQRCCFSPFLGLCLPPQHRHLPGSRPFPGVTQEQPLALPCPWRSASLHISGKGAGGDASACGQLPRQAGGLGVPAAGPQGLCRAACLGLSLHRRQHLHPILYIHQNPSICLLGLSPMPLLFAPHFHSCCTATSPIHLSLNSF